MDVIALIKEGFQSVAEHAASYKMGQTVLRHVDRALWVVENCARWAVPPPLDPEERPQPELVRPLPWVFFLMMLVWLRVTRECISLVNLVLGKPPLRSADVVTYIQSKRRYLRTLKYQGNRMMRARTSGPTREPWHSGLRSLFEFTMCFRRQSIHYGNNNTTRVSNNDEVLVVKRSSKRTRQQENPAASTSEASMERLIEKMMVDLDADSDEDSSYTLTNATSVKSDGSATESDLESANEAPPTTEPQADPNEPKTPEPQTTKSEDIPTTTTNDNKPTIQDKPSDNKEQTPSTTVSPPEKSQTEKPENKTKSIERERSPARITEEFIQNETQQSYRKSPKKEKKIANGRTVKSTSERNIGGDRRQAAVNRAASADFATREKKENNRQTP